MSGFLFSYHTPKKSVQMLFSRFRNKTKFQEQLLILMETEFLEHETTKPFFWLRYIDDIFLFGHYDKKSLKGSLIALTSSTLSLSILTKVLWRISTFWM